MTKMNRLFRRTAVTILTVLILTGCAYDDSVRDLREQVVNTESQAITFSNGVIDNPVRIRTRAVTLLSDHSNTMGVWGWQTTPEGDVELLFLDQEVTFNAPAGKWTYSPLKYWQTNSNYRFYAYAPHADSSNGAEASIDSSSHAISIKGVTLQGCNIIDSGVPALKANFSQVPDIDWMVDRTGQTMAGIYRNEVVFNMQHILSKLCIKVCCSNTFIPDSLEVVTLDSIRIGNFVSQGDFTQNISIDSTGIIPLEWNVIDTLPRYDITSASNVNLTDTALFVLESLLIPQAVSDDQYIRVCYSIGGANGGYKNRMNNKFMLNNLFSRFEPGKNYIINIVIGPEPITFDGGVVDWDDNQAEEFINIHR